MNILIAPGDKNHYLDSLTLFLKRADINVYLSRKLVFLPFFRDCVTYKIDILHLHWISPYTIGRNSLISVIKFVFFLFDIILCKLKGVKFIWSVHNLYNHEKHLYKLEMFFNKIIFLLIKDIVVHSNSQKDLLIKFYNLNSDKTRVHVLYEGNYSHLYPPPLPKDEARKILKITIYKKVFLFFGNIRIYKGIDFLIDAFKKLPSDYLLIIAGNPYNYSIEKHIKNKISTNSNIIAFLKFIPEKEVSLFFSATDAVILPYDDVFNSGLPSLIISYGKCAIYSDIDFFDEILKGGGYVFKRNDMNSLVEILLKSDVKEMEKFGERNYSKMLLYTWEHHTIRLKKIYEGLLAN